MGINKGKLKREKKELERLFNLGRHWEFLLGVEKEGFQTAFPQETGKAWRAMVRDAFVSPGLMCSFFSRRRELTSAPQIPDLHFLALVERFIDGADVAAEVAALKSLSPMSQSMAKRLLQWDDTRTDTRNSEALLTLFVTAPGKVTVKQVAEAVIYFKTHCGGALTFLSDCFAVLRKANLKGAVAKKRLGVDLGQLAEIDMMLKEEAEEVPESILRLLLAPLLWQLSRLYENYCQEDNAFALELAEVTPYLSARLAGDRWNELERVLFEDDLSVKYEDDPRYVRKKIAAADFPEKVRLLRTMATTLHKAADDDYDDFGEFDDEPAPNLEPQIRADYLLLYQEVLAEIGRNRAGLSPREQRELDRVMGDVLERDFHDFSGEPRQCVDFLLAVAHAGLLNTKLAISALMIAQPTGNRILREAAESAITALPPPDKGDIHWLFKYFGFLSYPNISDLSPLIRQVRDNEALLGLIADLVVIQVTRRLVENRMMTFPGFDIFQSLMKGSTRNLKQEMTTFRSGLQKFSEITEFNQLFLMAESYPEGYVTEAGFKKVLAAQYARLGMVGMIKLMQRLPSPPPGMAGMDLETSALFALELRASLELLKEHFSDLHHAPLESLTTLLEILEQSDRRSVEAGFLIRLSTLLQERRAAGELDAAPLGVRVEALIRRAAGKTGKKGKRR